MSSSGSTTVTGTSGNDNLNGGSGDDVIDGGAGSDRISGGSGSDTLDGGSGSDSLNGGSGNDTLVYNVTENSAAGTRDVYTGGSGVDTVVVEFTLAQWLSSSTQTQIQQYLSHLAAYTSAKTGEVSNGSASDFTFTFGGSTLTVQMMEQLKVFVDGIELNPADQAVLALNDAATLGEDVAGVVIDVLDNDFVPDLVSNLQVASQPAHGTVAVLNNGAPGDPSQWTLKYTPETGAWNHLAQGETATETFTYKVTDADGDVATATVTLTVTGMNDAVLITSAAQDGAVVEDAQDTASPSDAVAAAGTISFSDADLSDGHGASFAASASNTTALGAFALAPVDEAAHAASGTVGWSYELNSAAAQALAEGEVVVEKYDVTISDGHGGQATQTVTITITGTNDKPVAMGDTGAADEDGTITGSVAANDGDVDHGAVLSYALVEPVAGLSLQADGSYSFNAGHAAYHHLAQGATETVVVNYTVTDEHGASSTSALTITLTGTNDVPVAVADTGSASEDTVITGSVATNDSDVDDGAVLSYALNDPIDGLTLNADGSYSFDAGNAAYQHLGQGTTATVVANYTVTDQHGASSTSTLTITLTGTNDTPVAVVDTNSATEDAVITGLVATDDSDVDDGAILSYTLNEPVDGLTLNLDGSYSFDAGNASYQHLAQGATVTVVANYTVTDEHGAGSTSTLTITLTGTNDVPVAIADTGSATEDTVITGSVAGNDSDVDDGAVLGYALDAPVDGLTLDADGSYSFDAGNAAYQHLAEGATATVVADYTVTDQHGASSASSLTITMTGTNDVPVAVADTGSATEDTVITGSVAANDSDVDDGAVLSYALDAPVDGLALNADGSYSFDAGNAAYQHLAQGATATVVANYTVTDQHGASSTSTLTFTLTGTNDVPVAVVDTDSASEDTVITGSVATNDSDVDDGAILSYSPNDPVDGLTLNADGSYSFNAGNAAYQHLAEGATATVAASYTVTDQHGASSTSTLTITLTGTNDVPVAVADTGSATEDSVITGSVATNDGDADDGAVLSYTLNEPVDGLTLNLDGSYSFDAGHSTYQHLAEGTTATVAANYTVTDDHGATSTSTLTITLTGTNDVPVAVADTGSATEDTVIAGSVATNDSDIDDGAVLNYSLNDPVDGLTLNADGSYSFDAGNAAYQHLAQGATATVVANYTVTDQHGASSASTLTITLTGTNDVPVAVADTGSATEDTAITGSVAGNDTDVDGGAALSYGLNAPVDGLTLNADGSYSFNAGHSTYQHLAEGATATVVANYTVTDDHGATSTSTLTITLTGTNDVPVAVVDTDSATEDTVVTGSVATNDSDIDDGAVLNYSLNDPVDGLTLNADGSYSFDAGNAAYQHLTEGATATVVANYTVTDQHGANSTSTLTITLTGTNDAPVAFADINGADAVIEAGVHPEDTPFAGDPVASGNLLANDTDVDAGDTKVVTTTGTFVGTYGSVIIAADGSWTYMLNDADPDTNGLTQGQAATDVFAYTMQDGTGATSSSTLTIDLTGTNDAPVAADDTASGEEDTPITTGNVLANDGDIDGSLTAASISGWTQGAHGSVIHNGDGSFTYNAGADFNGSDSFSYTVTDAHGATSTAVVNVTVGAVNDAPVASIAAASYAATEQVPLNLKNSGLSVSDVDAGAGAVTVTLSVGEGTLNVAAGGSGATVSGSGTGMVTLTGTLAQINALLNGDVTSAVSYVNNADAPGASTTLTLSVNDNGNAGSGGALVASDSASITVAAVNDAPVNTVPGAQTTAEDTPKSIIGLAVSDADAGSASLVTTLSVGHGNLSLATVAGGAAIAGNGTSSVTLTGTQAAINLTLAAAALYTPTANFYGSDTLTMSTSDGGNSGAGGSLWDSDTVAITVTAANDNPVATNDVLWVSNGTTVKLPTSVLLANDADIDGMALSVGSISVVSAPPNSVVGGVTVDTDGTFSFTTGSNGGSTAAPTVLTLDYVLNDGAGGTAVINGTITVNIVATDVNNVDTVNLTSVGEYQASYIDVKGGADSVNDGAFQSVLIGGSQADTLSGGAGNDFLQGGTQNDNLSGGAGDDVLQGGANNDVLDGGEGVDLLDFSDVSGSFSFTLAASGNGSSSISGNDSYTGIEGVIGNASANALTGNGAGNVLRGGGGNDTLDGAGGTDLLDLSDATAAINFTLVQSASNTSVTASGIGTDQYRNFEGVIGTAFTDTLTGTGSSDVLRGGGGNDTISGGNGNDTVSGGNGADLLTGGAGGDVFVFNTAPNAVDTIADFDANTLDSIELSKAIFGDLATNGSTLGAAEFTTVEGTGASADSGTAHVIYDSATGNVYYDADGGSAAGRTLFAKLGGVSGTFDHNDISVAP